MTTAGGRIATVEAALIGFVHALRAHGLAVGSEQVLTYLRALARLDAGASADLYWAGRATLVTSADQVPVYDEVFRAWFLEPSPPDRVAAASDVAAEEPEEAREDVAAPTPDEDTRTPDSPEPAGGAAAPWEILRDKHVGPCSPTERELVAELTAGLRAQMPRRRSRRTAVGRRGSRPELRRSLRRSLHTFADLGEPAWLNRTERTRRMVVLVDVSGSMAAFSRALLLFGHAARAAHPGTEVFCFGTRLTRVTDAMRRRDPEAALLTTAEIVFDWEGGTRIGEALHAYLANPTYLNLSRGAVVVVCSDGLERGDPTRLAAAMGRIGRLAHRVLWVNPLAADPRYRPETRGMRAALPAIDVLLPGAELADLRGVVDALPRLETRARSARPGGALTSPAR